MISWSQPAPLILPNPNVETHLELYNEYQDRSLPLLWKLISKIASPLTGSRAAFNLNIIYICLEIGRASATIASLGSYFHSLVGPSMMNAWIMG